MHRNVALNYQDRIWAFKDDEFNCCPSSINRRLTCLDRSVLGSAPLCELAGPSPLIGEQQETKSSKASVLQGHQTTGTSNLHTCHRQTLLESGSAEQNAVLPARSHTYVSNSWEFLNLRIFFWEREAIEPREVMLWCLCRHVCLCTRCDFHSKICNWGSHVDPAFPLTVKPRSRSALQVTEYTLLGPAALRETGSSA